GLEFADFIIKSENVSAVERSLSDIISSTVDDSSVIPKNKSLVKATLLGVIRDVIYRGSQEEKEYLRRLSSSYMLLFLLQCDPKVATYFATLAGKTKIFVCTSLLVPALSEFPLEKPHRRHWNLLVKASQAGIKLLVNGVIIRELAGHIRKSVQVFEEEYERYKGIYTDEIAIPYIKEILIRSYFYSLLEGEKHSFHKFIDNFVTPNSQNMEEELIEWLKYNFNIEYIDEESMDVSLDMDDLKKLTDELSKYKPSERQARTDAKTALNVYALREKYNERGEAGIFGYQTWVLSKDTITQKAVTNCFGNKYCTSCYIRPDFVYNYISLAPNYDEVTKIFDTMFPTLPGISVSHHVPGEICDIVHESVKEHSEKDPARIRAILRDLTDKLKTDPNAINVHQLRHYLDDPEPLK
ncbi:MAG: hypothetical protein KAU38_06205, partial [Desulfobacterales bacterium]|nr:hypothetical protein [Desulfobacterales bacterium]